MRISKDQARTIHRIVMEPAGKDARVRLFDSRLPPAPRP